MTGGGSHNHASVCHKLQGFIDSTKIHAGMSITQLYTNTLFFWLAENTIKQLQM